MSIPVIYRDVWGNKIPFDKIEFYYNMKFMESESRKHYTAVKDRTMEKENKRLEERAQIKLASKKQELED